RIRTLLPPSDRRAAMWLPAAPDPITMTSTGSRDGLAAACVAAVIRPTGWAVRYAPCRARLTARSRPVFRTRHPRHRSEGQSKRGPVAALAIHLYARRTSAIPRRLLLVCPGPQAAFRAVTVRRRPLPAARRDKTR